MNSTYRTWLIAGATVVLVLAALVIVPRYHYTAVKLDNGTVYIIDNFTGKTKGVSRGVMFDVEKEKETVAPKHKMRSLTRHEVSNIDGRMGYSYGSFSGDLYNANSSVVVTSVRVAVTTTSGGRIERKVYADDVKILPLTAAHCSVKAISGGEGAKYSWSIESATGYDIDE